METKLSEKERHVIRYLLKQRKEQVEKRGGKLSLEPKNDECDKELLNELMWLTYLLLFEIQMSE